MEKNESQRLSPEESRADVPRSVSGPGDPDTAEKGVHGTFRREITKKSRRRILAGREGFRGVWFGLGLSGMVGWSITIPALLGVALGIWLDRRTPAAYSWTLTGLVTGVVLGAVNAWYWIDRARKGM